jgi:hypothetical protein
MLMRLSWPIEDPKLGFLQLINDALDDYEQVLARLGYAAVGLPREWEIQMVRRRPDRAEQNELTCVVPVVRLAEEAA